MSFSPFSSVVMGFSGFVTSAGRRFLAGAALSGLALGVLTGCGAGGSPVLPGNDDKVTLQGKVKGGQQPISGSTIQLYAVGTTGDGTASTPLLTTTVVTGAAGEFSITGDYTCPSITSEVYLIAKGGNPGLAAGTNNTALALMAALGPCGNLTSATHIIINEATTVGSVWPLTPFMNSYLAVGSSVANAQTLSADFLEINKFINTDGGASPGPTLPAGFGAPVNALYSMANILASCANSPGGVAADGSACGNLFALATPGGGIAPTNIVDAALNISKNPFQNVAGLYNLSSASVPFQPTLPAVPADWTLKILPKIMLQLPSSLVGTGSTQATTFTLGQAAPAGGLAVSLSSSATGFVTVSPATVNVAAGASSGAFSYSGLANGPANLIASATGYITDTELVTATDSLISLGAIPVVAPGQSVSLPLSLGVAAPVGGVTVNFTSGNTGIATISPANVFIAAGLKVPTANPQVTGVTVGTTAINASAAGYAPGTRAAVVSVTASLPTTVGTPVALPTNATLTISAPAPVAGITFTLTTDNTAIATVPTTITVAAGTTTAQIPVTGVAVGTTTLRANSTGITETTSAVTVVSGITTSGDVVTGAGVEVSPYVYLPLTPSNPTTVTVTSNNTAVAKVTQSATAVGAGTTTFTNVTSTGALSFYVQGVTTGSTTVTISSPGYNDATLKVTVDPAGFVIYSPGNFTTTSFSADTSISLRAAILNPGTLTVLGYGLVSPAVAPLNVTFTSATTTVGTLTSPVIFNGGDGFQSSAFHPVGPGTSVLGLTTPGGFTTPTPSTTQSITATVTAPPINTAGDVVSGVGLEQSSYLYLSQTPPTPTLVTITSSNPAVALVSTSATVVGGTTTTFTNVTSTGALNFYVQGVSVGTTTLTYSAPGYSNSTVNVTINPAGFVIYNPGSFTTTSLSPNTAIALRGAILNPGTLAVIGYAQTSPAVAPLNVTFTSGTTTVGTLTSPVVFSGGDSLVSSSFHPVGAGTTVLSVTQPSGFSVPTLAGSQQITVTVTAPPIATGGDVVTGVNMQGTTYVYLSQTPTVATTITVTSSVPAVATISTSATVAGSPSTTFPNVVNQSAMSLYVQGQTVGTSVLTISAPGYATTTLNVTVDPAGFVIYSPGSFSTTTFSAATGISIRAAVLNPSTLAVIGYGLLNPGISTVNVPLTSGTPTVGSVVTSPVAFNGGDYLLSTNFQPIAAGTTTLTLGSVSGFSTPSTASSQQITVTVTAPPIATGGDVTTGVNMQQSNYVYLSVAPPSAVTVTVTSNNPAIATISKSATVVGTTTLTYAGVTNGNTLSLSVQGLALGTTTLTVSAPGYSNSTINVTVDPAGFVIYSPQSFSTTTFSPPTSIGVRPAVLSPGVLTVIAYGAINPGIGSVSVPFASGTPGTGTIASPVLFNAGDSLVSANFQPVGAGTTMLTLGSVAGFSMPSSAATQQITATVTAPPIATGGDVATGLNLEVTNYVYLSVAPPSAVNVTVTSNNPAIAVLSKSGTTTGSATLTYAGMTTGNALNFYVQGLATGTTTLTISAPGYSNATINVAVDPSGFVIYNLGNFSTTTFSTATSITVRPAVLSPGILTVIGYASLNPGLGAVNVPIASGTPGTGTVTSPAVFNGGDLTQTVSFQPVAAGTTTLTLGAVAGFSTPSAAATQQITATVTAPPIVSGGDVTTGANLQLSEYVYLSVTPPSAVTVTVTSNNPAVAVVSKSMTAAGGSAISFTGIGSTTTLNFFVQGLTTGSTTLTVTAPGYANQTINVTVDPAGFVLSNPGNFSTTVGAANTTVTIRPAVLSPGILTVLGYANLNPGIGAVSVPVGSTNLFIGTITTSPVIFNAGDTSQTTAFHPVAAGSVDIDIVSQPAGFTTPSQPVTQQLVVTVN